MAVTIVDRRTTVDSAEDETAGWTPGAYGVTTDSAEGTNAVAESIAIGDQSAYFTNGSGIDVSDSLVYIYSFNNALQAVWDQTIPPNALLLGDGTNRIGFHMAGGNKRVFNHLDGPTTWQCLLLDGSQAATQDTAGLSYADAGSFGSLNLSSVTDFGAYHETLSKALGGGYNVAVDIIRYGNDGLYILGGGVGTEGDCLDIAIADRDTATAAAHGIFRELNPVSFGCQGPLTFGRPDVATDSYFIDSGFSIAFEDRYVSDGKYYFNVAGHASATNIFSLSDAVVTTAGPSVYMSCSLNVDEINLSNVAFNNFRGPITFPKDTLTNNATHSIDNCSFLNQQEIYPGTTEFSNNTISEYSGSLLGAVVIEAGTSVTNWSNLNFIASASTGHALYIDEPGTYILDNFQYTDYGSADTSESVLYNNSGGEVTASIVNNGASPTVRNGAGSSTLIQNNVAVTFTGLKDLTEVRIYLIDTTTELAGTENATDGDPDDRTFTFSLSAGVSTRVVIHNLSYDYLTFDYIIPNAGTDVPIQQSFDRYYKAVL